MTFNMNGKKYATLAEYGVSALQAPGIFLPVTPSATPFTEGPCRVVWASADMTIDFVDSAGNEISTFPIAKGRNDIVAAAISAVSTGSVWACY